MNKDEVEKLTEGLLYMSETDAVATENAIRELQAEISPEHSYNGRGRRADASIQPLRFSLLSSSEPSLLRRSRRSLNRVLEREPEKRKAGRPERPVLR